ncbi:MAG: molybdopterin biosynthesis protein MoeY [Ferrovum sp.]|nr:molybdopterin biosynthesis protein MoeY [Ferrovum sp.]
MTAAEQVKEILEWAKWAPSGDNTQPWRFEIVSDGQVNVHGFDTRSHCLYDLGGQASHLALGALLENMRLAATRFGLSARIVERAGCPEEAPVFEVTFEAESCAEDPLAEMIKIRSVQRRPYRLDPLTPEQKNILESSVGPNYQVLWFESFAQRWAFASLTARAGKLRLTIPEAYAVHRDIIQWGVQFSEDRVPDQAIGLDALTLKLTHWIMERWERVEFFNRYLAGTLLPRIQLDFIPGLACAAHFALVARTVPRSLRDEVEAGKALQRFWLTATQVKLQLQPEMTPLIFRRYATQGVALSARKNAQSLAERIAFVLDQEMGGKEQADRAVFMGRIGCSVPARARSTRLPLIRLHWPGTS